MMIVHLSSFVFQKSTGCLHGMRFLVPKDEGQGVMVLAFQFKEFGFGLEIPLPLSKRKTKTEKENQKVCYRFYWSEGRLIHNNGKITL